MTSAVPAHEVPGPVRAVAGADAITPVWRNEAGGTTYRLAGPRGRRFVKWQPAHPEISLASEAERLRWASSYLAVPTVLELGGDADATWMVTGGLPGTTAVAPEWVVRPAEAVAAVGRGLRMLHDALPVAGCPWTWSPAERIADAERRGLSVPSEVRVAPPVDRLVVCHGDACCPNTLLGTGGTVTGHVDLGSLGVADRWADIAVAAMSTGWNYGPGWQDVLVDAYGVAPDIERIDYYQRLWHAT